MHRHSRPADGGRAVSEAGPGGNGRAAPVRREPAGGPVPEGGGPPPAGAVGHAYPPDPGPGDLWRPGRVGDRRAAAGAAEGGHLRPGRELPAPGPGVYPEAGGGGTADLRGVPPGGGAGPDPR